jgi:hypothetical protein
MKMGLSVADACLEAMRDLQPLLTAHGGGMNIVAMDKDGQPCGITSDPEGGRYLVMTDKSTSPEFRGAARLS